MISMDWNPSFIDIAYNYEVEKARNDTQPVNDILSKITTEIEEALKK